MSDTPHRIRRLRHWKQRWDPNARFIFRRRTLYSGEVFEAGDIIPETLANNRAKLRRFWEAKRIELAEFEAPNVQTGQRTTEERIEHIRKVFSPPGSQDQPPAQVPEAAPEAAPETPPETAPKPEPAPAPEAAPETPPQESPPTVDELGAGWYLVTLPNGSTEKVRGKDALKKYVADLNGE